MKYSTTNMWENVKVAIVATIATTACANAAATHDLPRRDISMLPPYKIERNVSGGLRIFGSELKGAMKALATEFAKFHPNVSIATTFMTSSEGAIAGLYTGISDLAPAGDEAKISDLLPFHSTFQYLPIEMSIATGGHEKRGTLWPAVIVVNKNNPLANLTMDQLDRIFGAERTGGWELGTTDLRSATYEDQPLFTAKYARNSSTNIRKWSDLNPKFSNKEIQTYGYIAPGFKIYMEKKIMHWSQKWNPNYREYVETKESTPDNMGFKVASERMLEEISKDPYGIGWAAELHVKNYPNLKHIAIAMNESSEAYLMTPQTVSDRLYPLTRSAYVYVNREPGMPMDWKVKEFFRFVLSREGQGVIADLDMYYALTLQELEEQLKRLE